MKSSTRTRREERRINHAVANRLQHRRTELGLSERQIADVLGMTVNVYRRYESGERSLPAGRLCLVERCLLVRSGWLLDGL